MELSDEEKKAIEYFKRQIPKLENIIDWNETFYINTTQSKILKNSLITIINLLDKQQKIIKELQKDKKVLLKNYDKVLGTFISKETIRERIKHNEKQKNIVVSVAKFEINDDGITGEGIEGLNDLIVYKSYEAVINELNYLLKENTLKEN